jgi:hypothetical protein
MNLTLKCKNLDSHQHSQQVVKKELKLQIDVKLVKKSLWLFAHTKLKECLANNMWVTLELLWK